VDTKIHSCGLLKSSYLPMMSRRRFVHCSLPSYIGTRLAAGQKQDAEISGINEYKFHTLFADIAAKQALHLLRQYCWRKNPANFLPLVDAV